MHPGSTNTKLRAVQVYKEKALKNILEEFSRRSFHQKSFLGQFFLDKKLVTEDKETDQQTLPCIELLISLS